ncbi:MAG: thiopurine S-methyltransferase [Archangium sp.]
MQPDFWKSRWAEGKIGFHEGRPNESLVKHFDVLRGARRVFVPLCGKSEDLAYLASQGIEVVGVELVEDAVKAFFAEHGLDAQVTKKGVLTAYRAAGITIFAGDFFAVTPTDVGEVDAFYDRAALIALPPPLREKYVAHVKTLVKRGLLITVEYPQDKLDGPPFAVMQDEVAKHYPGAKELGQSKAAGPRLEPLGAQERVYSVG